MLAAVRRSPAFCVFPRAEGFLCRRRLTSAAATASSLRGDEGAANNGSRIASQEGRSRGGHPPRVIVSHSQDIHFNLAAECFLTEQWSGVRIPLPGEKEHQPSSFKQALAARGADPGNRCSSSSLRKSRGSSALAEEDASGASTTSSNNNPTPPLLFLWRNDRTVVIGRNQNAWRECCAGRLEAEGVKLARRYTGGGAVYQDLGNTCFSILTPHSRDAKELNNRLILQALEKHFAIKGRASGRNDLVVEDGRKFSGSAYYKTGGCWMHHGTLMLNVDQTRLGSLLSPAASKLRSHAVESVRSRVVNLSELNPSISHEGDVGLNVQDGKVSQAKVFSDALSTELIEAFQEALPGELPSMSLAINEFAEWIAEASQP